jgi:3-methyl-2-oxobutanoate hydroxymethyltransferase
MSAQTITRRLTQADLAKLYQAGEKVVMFTCYDASFARLLDGAGVESAADRRFAGQRHPGSRHDAAGHRHRHRLPHRRVKRGCDRPFIIADMPFGSYQESPEQAFRNAVTLMAAGAQMVKLEGGQEMAATVAFLVQRGIPVCGHVGLTPQSVHALGGYKVQGKGEAAAQRLKDDALALQNAGATMIVLEAIPAVLATEVTASLQIITIGIGAGKDTSGQVMVLHDAFDIPPGKKAKFVRNFMDGATSIHDAACRAVAAIQGWQLSRP